MALAYHTPGVYVEEVSTFPPSVAEVATAVPAFLGHTDAGPSLEPTRIGSMIEYEQLFGGAPVTAFRVDADDRVAMTTQVAPAPVDPPPSNEPQADAPVPDPVPMPRFLLYHALQLYFDNGGGPCYIVSVGGHGAQKADAAAFKQGLDALEAVDEPTLIVLPDAVRLGAGSYGDVCKKALNQCARLGDRFAIFDMIGDLTSFRGSLGTDHLEYGAAYAPYLRTTLPLRYDESRVTLPAAEGSDGASLKSIETSHTARYQAIKGQLAAQRVTLPPSAAVAGVYARTDRDRGVWKAPANVSLNSVIAPLVNVTTAVQDGMNVDATGGKSINAIRSFNGKGTLVWGARTLAGNDNEWRYVNVRRLFILIEESTRKATAFAVFEANDATTWLKVKGMIESFLFGLWERGALAGPTPESAYFVNVGLGKTMTAQDILEGRMIVEIGVAAVRPAEFIVLRFSHKLQEA